MEELMQSKQLHITRETPIKVLQDEFNEAYPYLRIEFFKKEQSGQKKYAKEARLPPSLRLGDVLMDHMAEGTVELTDDMTLLDLVKILKAQFGLVSRLFRKSGNLWMEITMSEDWTLGQQNDHGREISRLHKHDPEKNGTFDYDSNLS